MISTRQLGPNGFSRKKDRALNDLFRSESGRWARRHVARAFTNIAKKHGIILVFDPRSNAERGLPVAEDRVTRSYVRNPDGVVARAMLARRDEQRQLRLGHAAGVSSMESLEVQLMELAEEQQS